MGQHLNRSEKESFAQSNFLPLLPQSMNLIAELGDSATDPKLKLFYESKVLCKECNESGSVPCENLSIFSLRVVLQKLLDTKKSPRVAKYPMYESEAEMKREWASLPGVQPGNNPDSRLMKHAHCYQAVMWHSQHLNRSEKESFAQSNFLPLLPQSMNLIAELGDSAIDPKLKLFYKSKVLCKECNESGSVPCEDLSIFSLRVVLQKLLDAKKSPHVAKYPMYESEAEMKREWASLPGVQPGNNPDSRLVKHAHCYQAVMWHSQHLNRSEKESFAQSNFLP